MGNINDDLIKLNKWVSDYGVYVITGEVEKFQKEISCALCSLNGNYLIYKNMQDSHMSTDIIEDIVETSVVGKSEVVLMNASATFTKKYVETLSGLSEDFDIRIFICCDDKKIDIKDVMHFVRGTIQVIIYDEAAVAEFNVEMNKRQKFIVDIDRENNNVGDEITHKKIKVLRNSGYEKIASYLEMYMKKGSDYKDIAQNIVERCFEDICINKKVCDLELCVNTQKYRKYEITTDKFILKLTGNIVDLWQNVLEQENGLHNYVGEVLEGDLALLFIYKQGDLSKVIATIEVCNYEIKQFVYKGHNQISIEMEKWLKSYVSKNNLRISGNCYYGSDYGKKEGPAYKGIFWIKDIENIYTSLVCVKEEVNKDGIVNDNSNMNSRKGNNYNHRITWDNYNHRITWEKLEREVTDGKPYNYYPRGRVEIRNGKATIYAHPDICTHEIMTMIINEFNLHKENNIDKVVMNPDYSKHYNCYLDEKINA